MSRNRKHIKKYYKKSVLPSILLLLAFIIICQGLFLSFVVLFQEYLMDSKAADLYEKSGDIGEILSLHMQEGPMEAANFLKEYLGADNDICITDDKNHILQKFGESTPDFDHAENMGIIEKYIIYPNLDPEKPDEDDSLYLSYGELLQRSVNLLEQERTDDNAWMDMKILDGHFWAEIPVRCEGFHLYYKDSVTLAVKNIFFVITAIIMDLSLLTVLFVLLFINVISSFITQRRMINLLYLDSVTGGKNWFYFVQHGRKLLCRLRNHNITYALVNLHMNRYQDYCACYGNKTGDELLGSMDAFLKVNIRKQEVFARFASADFGLLLRCDSTEQCKKRLRKLLAELTGIQRGRALSFNAGIYQIPSVKDCPNDVNHTRKRIDITQIYHYAAAARKSLYGKEGKYIKFFDDQILQEQLWKRRVESTMEDALLNKEFQIYLQPKYNPASCRIVGAEALVRWVSPTDGVIPPKYFIPIFEGNGFITKLDYYMISAVSKLQSEWKIQGRKNIPISVNVSRANFTKEDLAFQICQLVDAYGTDRSLIELEVTESAFFGDKEILQKTLKELKDYGFCISMDDFGAGYSSLNSLKDLPLDVLKLDMEFFKGDTMEERGEIVVKEAIRLAKNLNMKIVAEGIETKEYVDFLLEQECDMIQGYYFAKPMPVLDFEKQMEQDG